ncbi:MAG: hypothetical protein QM820_04545 [Minicystis sp.]
MQPRTKTNIAREMHVDEERFSMPELRALRELRGDLARGKLLPLDKRAPGDDARLAAYRTLAELLSVIEEYRRRVERGARCRLVEREHPCEPGMLVLEFAIVEEP